MPMSGPQRSLPELGLAPEFVTVALPAPRELGEQEEPGRFAFRYANSPPDWFP